MSQWFQFEGPDFDEDTHDTQLDQHERAALAAIRAIADLGEAHPDKALIVAASLRKISTVAQSRAQSIGLRPVTVRKGGR